MGHPGTPGKAGGVWDLKDEACMSDKYVVLEPQILQGNKRREPGGCLGQVRAPLGVLDHTRGWWEPGD